MYSFITILAGAVLAVMIVFNGELSIEYGVFGSSVIIQTIGTVAALMAILVKREKFILKSSVSKWYYLTGVITVSITVFQSLAFHYISMTSIIALGLVGQTVISIVIDQFGLFGMQKTSLSKSAVVCLIFAIAGIVVMSDGTMGGSILAITLSLVAGIAVVLSRVFNAKIAEHTSVLQGSFVSYILGLPAIVIVAWFAKELTFSVEFNGSNWWMYLGGILGVLMVLMYNITVPRVSAFKLTMFVFFGQVLTGIVLDLAFQQLTMDASFWGGIIISIGVLISKIIER